MKKVLYVCVHNSGRSQMAEALTNRLGGGEMIGESAGTEPGTGLNPTVVEVMREIGYDMSGHYPKVMSQEMIKSADKIITMGCGVDATSCPAVFVPSEDWGLDDPKGQPIEKVRQIRDQIQERVKQLIQNLKNSGGDNK